jgi:hypothetical protein
LASQRVAPHVVGTGDAVVETHGGVLRQRIERLVLGLMTPRRRREDQVATVVRRQAQRVVAALVHAEAELPERLRARVVGALQRCCRAGIRALRTGQDAEQPVSAREVLVRRRCGVRAHVAGPTRRVHRFRHDGALLGRRRLVVQELGVQQRQINRRPIGRLDGRHRRMVAEAGRVADHAFEYQVRPDRAGEPVRERRATASGRTDGAGQGLPRRLAPAVLPAAAADGHVAEGTALCPVAAAGLAEVARLAEAVVVVVAELGVVRVAARAAGRHLHVRAVPPVVVEQHGPPPTAAASWVGGQHVVVVRRQHLIYCPRWLVGGGERSVRWW